MGGIWAFTELRERTLELVKHILSVKHTPSTYMDWSSCSKGQYSQPVLTKHSQSSQKSSAPIVILEYFGKVAKVRETNLWATVKRKSRNLPGLHHKMKKIQAL